MNLPSLKLSDPESYNDEGRREWLDVFTEQTAVGTAWEKQFADGLYARREFTPRQT